MDNVDIDPKIWVADYEEIFHGYVYARIKDHELAADIVQDTFLAGLRALDRFQGKSTVKTWLFSILKRKIVDHWRTQGIRKTNTFTHYQKKADTAGTVFEHNFRSDYLNADCQMENKELREILHTSIYALPKKWIPIVLDRMIGESSCEDICKKYNLSRSNVWVILFRARNLLRENLNKTWMSA